MAACASSPPYEGLGSDELFQWAISNFEDEDWEDAVTGFEQFIAQFPTDPRRAEAQYLLAVSHLEDGEALTAISEFERFQERWTLHALSPQVSFGICRAYAQLSPIPQRDQTYTRRARDACARTALEFSGEDLAQEADSIQTVMTDKLAQREYEVGRFYQRRDLHDSAIISFERITDLYPETEWAPRAFMAMYNSYQAIGWEPEAEEAREQLIARYPDSDEARNLQADRDGR